MEATMQTRPLGKTGLNVSALGYGAAPLGGVYHGVDEAEAIATVHAAFDAGVNYIDVAPYYGILKAEMVLGRALKTVPRDRYILSTKVGRYGMDDFDFSADRVARSVDESLQRLGIDYIDLIICHDVEFVSLDQVVNEAIPALERARDQGKVGFIGVSGLPIRPLATVAERTKLDFILSYCHYNLFDTTLAAWLPKFQSLGLGIINASPLSMGLLSDLGPPEWHPASDEIKQATAAARQYCREQGIDIARIALQFALANPDIATTLCGMKTPEQLQQNLECVGTAPDPEHLKALQAILAPIRDQTWPSGRPENA
jgi:L-galactose dehydrogenase